MAEHSLLRGKLPEFRRPTQLPVLPASLAAMSLALTALLACTPDAEPPAARATLAIEDVSVIPMDGERVLIGVTVLIGDGRVLAVQPLAEADVPDVAARVDGRGRFLIPGLNDMHVHFGEESALGRFLATGVTGVRILSGGPQTLGFRDRVESGELAGPDIHTAGPIIEGLPPPGIAAVIDTAGRAIVRDSLDGARTVREQQAAGYDFIKVYNNVPAAAYRGIVAEARRLGIRVAGHVPFEVGLDGILAAGQASIEHLRGYIWHLVPEEAPAQPGPRPALAHARLGARRSLADRGARRGDPRGRLVERADALGPHDSQAGSPPRCLPRH